jgi:hypothetical protein
VQATGAAGFGVHEPEPLQLSSTGAAPLKRYGVNRIRVLRCVGARMLLLPPRTEFDRKPAPS